MPSTVQNGAELGAPGDEYNKSPCRDGRPRLLKDKTHHPTTPYCPDSIPQNTIPGGVVGQWVLSLSNLGLPSLLRDLFYSSTGTPSSAPFWTVQGMILTVSGRHFRRLTYKFDGAWWLRIASWRCFSGFLVYRNSCSTSLACLFNNWIWFSRKKSCFFLVNQNPTLELASYLATLPWRKDDEDYFYPKLHVHFNNNNNSPHGRFHRFLFP